MKKIVAVAPFKREGIINFKIPPYEAWKRLGGAVAPAHYPPITPLVGWFHNHELPHVCKSGKEARLRFMEAINRKYDAFPDYARYEIVPLVWDCWPCLDDRLGSWLKKHKVKTAIFTSRQNAERIQRRFPSMHILAITEGIDTGSYSKGKPLSERSVDVLEFGRTNRAVVSEDDLAGTKYICTSKITPRLTDRQLFNLMADSKVTIALTKLDTDPRLAGGVDTLTQRFWEGMLSRMVMVGRAPEELTDLIGYNPCVNVKQGESYQTVIQHVLSHISDYQELVDRNRDTAMRMAPWEIRMKKVMDWLEGLGYCTK